MPQPHKTPLGEELVSRGLVTPEQLEEAIARQRLTGEKLGEALVCLRYVTRCDLWMALGAPWIALEHVGMAPECARLFTRTQLRKWQAVPVEIAADGTLVVAMADPLHIVYTDEMWRTSRMTIRACAAAPSEIAKLLSRMDKVDASLALTQPPTPAKTRDGVRSEAVRCEFCGETVERTEGGVLSSDELASAWCLAVALEAESSLSRHSIMADWAAKVNGGLRVCAKCQGRLADAQAHACQACGRPTHLGQGSVLVELGQTKLVAVQDEMQLRRRRCLGCGREFCLACAVRHGSAVGAYSPLCPVCNEPAEPPTLDR